jgi:cytoskeletal protein CcmA (bactofilin family)
MGIFSKNDKQPKSQVGTTVIGNDTSIKGVIDTKGSVYIDGKFEGVVVATNDVIIGVHGEVLGEIRAKTLTVNGLIDGMFDVEQVQILKDGKILGKLQYDELIIEQNGLFQGEGKKKNSSYNSKYNQLEANQQYLES